MVKLTLEELIASATAMQGFMTLKLPAAKAFKIGRQLKQLNPDIDAYNDSMRALADKYPVLEEKPKPDATAQEKSELDERQRGARKQMEVEIRELLKTTIEVKCELLPIALLDGQDVPISQMANLSWLFEDSPLSEPAKA